jgi:putative CocE/NonD family hydrolase
MTVRRRALWFRAAAARFAAGALVLAAAIAGRIAAAPAQPMESAQSYLEQNYIRVDYVIPMRDGIELSTTVFSPKDASRAYPFLLERTPFGANVYGGEYYRGILGPSLALLREGYILVRQEVRGTYGSGGTFVYLRPHLARKGGAKDVDESSDTYDTIEWLLANVPGHNGRVGMLGIDYAGFCAAAGMIAAHPALKAVSPQAPVMDFWYDSFHTAGAFNLMNALKFTTNYGEPVPGQPARYHMIYFNLTTNSYDFLLNLGPLSYVDRLYFEGRRPFWSDLAAHPDYDEFWKSRNILPHLEKTAPAVMTVGGWFDDRNLYGPLACYRAVEEKNPGAFNVIVMGPWDHAGWLGGYETEGGLGDVSFGSDTAEHFQESIELGFFEYFLKDKGRRALPEAYVFETGKNRWRAFDEWPPKSAARETLYLEEKGKLSFTKTAGAAAGAYDEFVSDPANPVPAVNYSTVWLPPEFMVQDQRFLFGRGDVLMYESEPLTEDVTVAGPLAANLWVSTSRSDADWVVKVIDVFPAEGDEQFPRRLILRGYHMLVRAGVLRGRFRDGGETPKRFAANEPSRVTVELQDVCHTFRKGHRIMVHVQSSWFPYIDRNPQKWVDNIFRADTEEFAEAKHRVYRAPGRESYLEFGVLREEGR